MKSNPTLLAKCSSPIYRFGAQDSTAQHETSTVSFPAL